MSEDEIVSSDGRRWKVGATYRSASDPEVRRKLLGAGPAVRTTAESAIWVQEGDGDPFDLTHQEWRDWVGEEVRDS